LNSLMRPLRPRFTLLTLLWFMALVGLGVQLFLQSREIGPLREELQQLRNEVGRLSIEDESKFHAIEVRTEEEHTWKWRVWVPEGETIEVHSQWGKVPRKGVSISHNTLGLEAGEHWITLSARRDPESGLWLESMATEQGSVGGIIQPSEHWFDWKQSTGTSEGVSHTTFVAPDDEKIVVLKRFRVAQVNSSDKISKSDEPTAGFIIWLERQ